MSIKLNNSDIKSVTFNSTDIDKVYFNGELVWHSYDLSDMKSIQNYEDSSGLNRKRVMVRVDFGGWTGSTTAPTFNNFIRDKIQIILPTLNYLLSAGSSIIIIGTQGTDTTAYSFSPLVNVLSNYLKTQVTFLSNIDAYRQTNYKAGSVYLLENVWYLWTYTADREADSQISKILSAPIQVFVVENPSWFSRDINYASVVGVASLTDTYLGLYTYSQVGGVINIGSSGIKRPWYLLTNREISDTSDVENYLNLLYVVDGIFIGNNCIPYLAAMGINVNTSQINQSVIEGANTIINAGEDKVFIGVDFIAGNTSSPQLKSRTNLNSSDSIFSIGSRTFTSYRSNISNAGTLYIDSPLSTYWQVEELAEPTNDLAANLPTPNNTDYILTPGAKQWVYTYNSLIANNSTPIIVTSDMFNISMGLEPINLIPLIGAIVK